MNAIEAASGRWPDLLAHFCGLTPEQLSDKHQPCPLCGGKDRYRFDDKDGTGSWYCNKCGGKDQTGGGGTGMDLFMRHQRLTYIEACQRIEQHLGIAKPIPEPPIAHGKSAWRYSDTFYVVRKDKPDGGKDILPLTWDGSAWKWKAPPAPRPLYGKRQLALKPDAPVLVVEGEKTADAAALLYPSAVVITWPSGCKAIDKADWSPLAGRRCVLWPDADDAGREAMAKLAIRLLKAGADQVRIVHPPADVPEGWDLADADWSVAAAAAYLKNNRSAPIQLPELAPEAEPEPVIEPEPLPDGNDYFTCLGFDHDAFYYQPHSTGQVTRLSRSAHTGTNLCAIAPLAYWEALYPSKTGANWTAAASSFLSVKLQQVSTHLIASVAAVHGGIKNNPYCT
jgi:putative DNA primase/helicase